MPTLYDIDKEIMSCVDAETGELIDPQRLKELQMERERKIENVALWIKNLKADLVAYKSEKEAFANRERRTKAKIDSLSNWLTEALDGQKFNTNKVAISFRKSEFIDITDEKIIPSKYKRIKAEPDKIAIKEALKNNLQIPGAALIENRSISIK